MQETKKIVTQYVLLILLGIVFISFNYYNKKKIAVFDEVSMELYNLQNINVESSQKEDKEIVIEEEPVIQEIEPEVKEENTTEETSTYKEPYYYYIGTLEIPKINLSKGFVDIDSSDNNVDKNIAIVRGSLYPNYDKGNFILAAHSGNGYLGFFNRLYELTTGDQAYIYFSNTKYVYTIVNIYTQAKTGKINIYRDTNKNTLTLVTCTNNDESTQTVYIAELTDKQNY